MSHVVTQGGESEYYLVMLGQRFISPTFRIAREAVIIDACNQTLDLMNHAQAVL